MRGALLATVSTLLFAGGPPELIGLRTGLSAETLRLPQQETMGLLGLSSTAEFGPFYMGPSLYGAARGVRGGFFTFGLEGGLRKRPFPSLPLELEAGLFIGGGGGGNAPQGGGLMLRPHLGAAILMGSLRVGADLSRVRFPNGRIDSTQAALTLAFRSDHLWIPEGGPAPTFEGLVNWEGHGFEVDALRVDASGVTVPRAVSVPQRPFDLAGFSLTRDLDGPWFRFLSAGGAARGSSSGYAQALAGLGLGTPLLGPLGVEARLGAGMGGGGGVDTGGGFLFSGEGTLTLEAASWRAAMGLGFLRAPGGQLSSRTFLVRMSHRSLVPRPMTEGETLAGFDPADWRVGSGYLVYRQAQRLHQPDRAVQVMTLRADRQLGDGFYLSGEAGSAVGGSAGGYSTGLAGLGCETHAWARQRLFLEAALGAGGGGDLRTGGGLLASLRTGWRLELPFGLGLDAAAGRVRALRGDLATTTYGLGLHLRFESLAR